MQKHRVLVLILACVLAIPAVAMAQGGAADQGVLSRPYRGSALDAFKFRGEQVPGCVMIGTLAIAPQDRAVGAGQLRRRPDECLQNRIEVEIRPADRTQDFGRRRLQFPRLVQFGDVAGSADNPSNAAGLVTKGNAVLARPAPSPGTVPIPVFAIEPLTPGCEK